MNTSPHHSSSQEDHIKKSLKIPTIPRFPSSLARDKENQRQQLTKNNSSPSPFSSSRSTKSSQSVLSTNNELSSSSGAGVLLPSLKPPAYDRGNLPQSSRHYRPLHNSSDDYSPSKSSCSSLSRRRVLHFGESLESLFNLDSNCSEEHYRLCRAIVDGISVDDASVWRRVLELSTASFKDGKSFQKDFDLVRLHKRATSRFLDQTQLADRDDILAIWLSYAKAQATREKDARLALKHIQKQQLGEYNATFYLVVAELEQLWGYRVAAIETLRLGIKKNAQPLRLMQEALKKYNCEDDNLMEGLVEQSSEQAPSLIAFNKDNRKSKHSPKRRKSELVSPNKRRKTEAGISTSALVSANTKESKSITDVSRGSGDEVKKVFPTGGINTPIRFQDGQKSRHRQVTATLEDTPYAEKKSESNNDKNIIDNTKNNTDELKNNESASSGTVAGGNAMRFSSRLPSSRKKVLKRTPLRKLGRTGIVGKAQRVDPSQLTDFESDSESETECLHPAERKVDNRPTSISAPVKKITKEDLGYMFSWNPDRPLQNTKSAVKAKMARPPMLLEKIDEAPSLSSTIGSSQVSNTSTSQENVSCNFHEINKINATPRLETSVPEKTNEVETVASGRQNKSHDTTPGSSQSRTEAANLVSKANPDFLPLVSEGNILTVNNIPYAKLGVIGKGGSCKVYRALSRDCSVVAIKKVKIAGKAKRAIDGYANEISLLKRLRGNPAIIQMFDSEVDLDRKAIFLVMEVGEVDLNHVLQQQTLVDSQTEGDGRRHLNMNFIRLTWQQMLSAVQCIHEARIIHGDLKPANFLFVRGALKLIDFGIAKAIQSDDTTNIYRDSQIGTLNYMSPEAILDTGTGAQGARMKMGRASDIWSLGCILYQMVYGKGPFADLRMFQKLQAIVDPKHTISFPTSGDDAAVDVMKQCLQRDPEARPPIVGTNGLLNAHRFLNS